MARDCEVKFAHGVTTISTVSTKLIWYAVQNNVHVYQHLHVETSDDKPGPASIKRTYYAVCIKCHVSSTS